MLHVFGRTEPAGVRRPLMLTRMNLLSVSDVNLSLEIYLREQPSLRPHGRLVF